MGPLGTQVEREREGVEEERVIERETERSGTETEERPVEKGRLLYLFKKLFTHKHIYTMELQSLLVLNSSTELCLLLSLIRTGLHPDTIFLTSHHPSVGRLSHLPLSHGAVPQGCHRHPSPSLRLLREPGLSLQRAVHLSSRELKFTKKRLAILFSARK